MHNTLSSFTPSSVALYQARLKETSLTEAPSSWVGDRISLSHISQSWLFFTASVFLVSVPVFFQAPLVRWSPWLSLIMTLGWLGLSQWLKSRPSSYLWGDLLFGFTWTWLAGSIYWGWFRWEPFLHLPIESLGLPFTLWCLAKQHGKVGNWFYLGSLFGTVMTDLYFYVVNLIPHWRQLMQIEPSQAQSILQSAVAQIQTPWGTSWAIFLISVLLIVGCLPVRSRQLHWRTFGGAVLSTLLVDGLFWLAASSV
ncbi:MAG: DUF3120 domain-containing protein [Leptolyngbyaceae cyanobacterium SL_5_9]|nr:DUF3120 domain-containing protein [Leptolyngbyaceae cyanobacterium SL_5_9]NJO72868.1 DUF3120 domain-containing protein [Leptolyngbyaceae cyanobacterium RM1_406_9]